MSQSFGQQSFLLPPQCGERIVGPTLNASFQIALEFTVSNQPPLFAHAIA